MALQTYRIDQTYDWNFTRAPAAPPEVAVPPCPGEWDFCGIPVNSPLGVPAGPLLNSAWVLYYAALGFDVVTYKTVRSRERSCYGLPNLLPVRGPLADTMEADSTATDSWAISFGMPSKDPAEWTLDVERTRRGIRPGQVLVVSVVASPSEGWSLEQTAADYAECARLAREAGAQAIEANLSCPNVCTAEGQIYLSAHASQVVTAAVREASGRLPLILKIGPFDRMEQMEEVLCGVAPFSDAVSSVNTVSAVVRAAGSPLDGVRRGIGGTAIRERALEEVRRLKKTIDGAGLALRIIGVGGVSTAVDVQDRLNAGAHHVQIATAAMLDPLLACRIRETHLGELTKAFSRSRSL